MSVARCSLALESRYVGTSTRKSFPTKIEAFLGTWLGTISEDIYIYVYIC